ncbi:MAG: VWA domain-containing protein [Gammaproteobacteria bacterium]|nr:VWA domain-containing protein [Gammaproteobacteria bacterium]
MKNSLKHLFRSFALCGKILMIVLAVFAAGQVFATGLQPVNTDAPVQIYKMDFDVEVQGMYVAGIMEVRFIAAYGHENAANMRFPLPPDAVLHKAEVFLPESETWIQAETVGRREGENVFNDLTQTQELDPLLVQQIGKDFYRARVYPVAAGGDLRIRIHYAHLLETAGDNYLLRIPFANPDATAATPARGVNISVVTDSIWQKTEAWFVEDSEQLHGEPDSSTTHLELLDFTLDRDITLKLTPSAALPDTAALHYQSQTNSILHAWWHPDFSAYPEFAGQPRNVVFVIDISGSMSGAKMEQTRQAVIHTLNALNAEDYFGVVAFESEVYQFQDTMLHGTDIQAATEWVAGLLAGGGTAISNGLAAGAAIGALSPLSNASVDLLFITDGHPTVGSSTADDILADIGVAADQLGRRLRIFSIGIGYDLDQELLNSLAARTGGESVFALDDSAITGQVLDLFGRIRGGGLNNVALQMENAQNSEDYARPRIFPGTELQMGIQDAFGEAVTLRVSGSALDFSIINLETPLSPLSSGNSGIHLTAAPLAAKTWADRLEQRIDQQAETTELVDEAVRLARTYGIVTRYSSLLALETEALYSTYNIERIARDNAGIATQPVSVSSVDESRLGGAGTHDSGVVPSTSSYTTSTGGGCEACSPVIEIITIACDDTLLDSQFFLYIPRISFQGIVYWASLRLIQMEPEPVFEMLTYQRFSQPDQSPCPMVASLSSDVLSVPEIVYKGPDGEVRFTEVEMRALANAAGSLKFTITAYKNSSP